MGLPVYLELGAKKAFACAVDWPGWCRSGKTPELALEALAASADRYAAVAREAGFEFRADIALEVVERAPGGSGTDFGVPSAITDLDRRPLTVEEGARLGSLVAAAWSVFDRVVASAPAELRKGPRGGGRDRDKIMAHVVEAEWYYAREIGLRLPQPVVADPEGVAAQRAAMLAVLRQASDGSPLAGRKWTARYAARRIAWHAIDHAWEIEDRSAPEATG